MRHLKDGRTLNRNASHRLALFRNLTRALFEHGRIITTEAKAKEVRRFVEKMITLAKRGGLHARRLVLSWLPDPDAVNYLFNVLVPRYEGRPGGYTRVIKRDVLRLGDNGKTAYLELLREGETKPAKKRRAVAAPAPISAPAPVVEEPTPTPTPEVIASTETPANPETPPATT